MSVYAKLCLRFTIRFLVAGYRQGNNDATPLKDDASNHNRGLLVVIFAGYV